MKLSLITVLIFVFSPLLELRAQSLEQVQQEFTAQTRQLEQSADSLFPVWEQRLSELMSQKEWRDSIAALTIDMATKTVAAGDPSLGIRMLQSLYWKHNYQISGENKLTLHLSLSNAYCEVQALDSMRRYLSLAEEQLPHSSSPKYHQVFYGYLKGFLAARNNNNLEALEYYLKVMPIAEAEHFDQIERAIKVSMIGVYMNIKHYEKGIELGNRELKVHGSNFSDADEYTFKINLGLAYYNVGKLDSAIFIYRDALATTQRLGDKINEARLLTNLGNALRANKAFTEAVSTIDNAVRICKEYNLEIGILINLINKAELFYDMRRYPEALELLKEAERIIGDYKNEVLRTDLNRVSALIYSAIGDYQTAFRYQKAYSEATEEMYQKQQELLILDWEANLEREKQEQEIEALQAEVENARRRQLFLYTLGLMALISVVLGYRLLVNKHAKDRLQAKLNREESVNLRLQLEMKEKELASQSMHLQSIKAFSDTMTIKLKQFNKGLPNRSEEELSKLISEFEHRFPEALWEDFQMRFEKINDSFYQKLMEKCPDLTPVEIKLAGLLRLNLSTKEISDLTNRSIGTIANTRSTLRKKLQLENDDNLVSYLISL
jgi:tetratricopeptide (TPR) repeat protein/DNA-binding CsgD family transcriptional regulator